MDNSDLTRPVVILTRPPTLFFKGSMAFFTKQTIKRMLGISRGPDSLAASLFKSLALLDIPFVVNRIDARADTVHVLSNPHALAWALKQKLSGRFKHVIAGPNITVLPTDFNNLLCDPAIDTVILPSEWTKQAYTQMVPALEDRIRLWPVGVPMPEASELHIARNAKPRAVLYKKNVPADMYESIKSHIISLGHEVSEIIYGSFKHADYLAELSKADYVVYLQHVESQGIALQEAWSYDVPTLVWNPGTFTYPGTSVTVSGQVSSPYLTPECGQTFYGADAFAYALQIFLPRVKTLQQNETTESGTREDAQGVFEPRNYCQKELSLEASGRKYVTILDELDIHN